MFMSSCVYLEILSCLMSFPALVPWPLQFLLSASALHAPRYTLTSSMYTRWVIGSSRNSLRNPSDFLFMAIESGARHRQKSRSESTSPWNSPLLKLIARVVVSPSSFLSRMSVAHLGMALATAFLIH